MGKPDEEHVRSGAAREPGRLRIQEKDVLPSGRRFATKPEVRDEQRIDGSPSDDLEPEIADVDPPLENFKRLCVCAARRPKPSPQRRLRAACDAALRFRGGIPSP